MTQKHVLLNFNRFACNCFSQEVLIHDRVEDLNKTVSLVFAIFHIDLGEFTILFAVIFKRNFGSS